MIRKARVQDLDELDLLYENARNFMHSHGNPNQWNDGHPCSRDLLEDIKNDILYVIEEDDQIQASFVFYIGEDPTYQVIEHGRWLNDEPYGVAHKVASAAKKPGMGRKIIEYVKSQYPNIRMDTHADNIYMRRLLESEGFVETGIIYLENGDPRCAFQFLAVEAGAVNQK